MLFLLLLPITVLISCDSTKETPPTIEDLVDSIVEIESGRDIRILQLTDTQIIDASQSRSEDRLDANSKIKWATNTIEANCFNYIRDTIEMTNPDLILITGDVVYGEFDDTGTTFRKVVKYMDSFKIPWAIVFGNHDNESKMGVDWQCELLENAEYSLFKRGNVTGNSNYTIGIVQDGELKRVIYMMDTNGCANSDDPSVKNALSFAKDQLEWFDESANKIEEFVGDKVNSFVCFHVPVEEFGIAAVNAGYQKEVYEENTYTIGSKRTPAQNGDFGVKGELYKAMHPVPGLFELFKKHAVDGVFVGHSHLNSTSVLYEGIRWTFGLKTGTYDRYSANQLGGTYIEVHSDNSFTVEHKYVKHYKIEPDTYSHIYMGLIEKVNAKWK